MSLSTLSSALTKQKAQLVTPLINSVCFKCTFPEKGVGPENFTSHKDQAQKATSIQHDLLSEKQTI